MHKVYKFYRRKEEFRSKDGRIAVYLPATDDFPNHLSPAEWEFVGRALPPAGVSVKELSDNRPIYRSCPPGLSPKVFYPEI
jgi:hypothetical protein